jgi:hypothetical protein
MNKENILTFRLPGGLYRDLSQRAEKEGCTISELARKIITEHARAEEISRALADITKKHSAEHAQLENMIKRLADGPTASKGAKSHDGDIAKILLLVTWLVDASPFASNRRSEHGLG